MIEGKRYFAESFIRNALLLILGLYCVGCAIFWSSFAELNIDLTFLDFPIFIGEILLAICLALLFYHWKKTNIKFHSYYYWLAAYALWILGKTFYGYVAMGPLAFRNAALFYYSFFAVVTYHFYDRKYFKQSIILFLLLIFIAIKTTLGFYIYFIPSSFILFLVRL